MKVVETLSKVADPWFGNNITYVCQDANGKYWLTSNNDAYPKDHPDYMKKLHEVKPVEVTKTEWRKV